MTDNEKLQENYDDVINFPNCIALCSVLSLLSFILCLTFSRYNASYLGNRMSNKMAFSFHGSLISIVHNNSCCCWRCICCCLCLFDKDYFRDYKHGNSMYKAHSSYFVGTTDGDHDKDEQYRKNKMTPSFSQQLLQNHDDEAPLYVNDQ